MKAGPIYNFPWVKSLKRKTMQFCMKERKLLVSIIWKDLLKARRILIHNIAIVQSMDSKFVRNSTCGALFKRHMLRG